MMIASMIAIDPTSVVTQEMVAKLVELQGVSEEAALGTLSLWEKGQGELDANIVDSEENREVFKAVRDAYFAVNGVSDAAYSSEEGLAAGKIETVQEAAPVEAESSGPTSTTETAE